MSETSVETLVVGGGISGLAYAHARGPGADLRVLEASERAGGLVRTAVRDGFRFEEGPEALPGTARVVRELARALEVPEHDVPRATSKRFLLLDGRLREVPSSPDELATSRILSIGAKFRLMAESSVPPGEAVDGSIADFARARLGAEALERVVDPIVAGIHAGDPEQLSLRACFPEVVRWVAEHGSLTGAMRARAKNSGAGASLGGGLWKTRGGMERLTEALARWLGPRLVLGRAVESLERAGGSYRIRDSAGTCWTAGRVVLALPLDATRRLLAELSPEAAAALATMPSESLVSIAHAYRREDVEHELDGFGYLVPKSAGGLVLGTLFSSTIDAESAPSGHVLLRSLLGGARHPQAVSLESDELLACVARECGQHLGLARGPVFAHVARYEHAIPRFDLEHLERRATLERSLSPGLAVLGNFTQGLGLDSLVGAAGRLAAS